MTNPALLRAHARLLEIRAARAERSPAGYVGPDPNWGTATRRTKGGLGYDESRPMEASEALYRCVTLQARTLAGIPMRYLTNWDGRKGTDLPRDHAIPRLFMRPNPHQVRREFVEAIFTNWLLDGEVFHALLDSRGKPVRMGEVPAEIWPVPGPLVRPDLESGRNVMGWFVRDWRTGEEVPFPAWALLPARFFNPYDPMRGLAPLRAAARGLRVDMKAAAWTEAMYANGAEPGGVLRTEQRLTKAQRDAMRTEWNDRHQGPDKAGRVAVLEGGLTYQATTASPKDLRTPETQRLSRVQVATVYGTPMVFLNDTQDLSYATARAAMRILWENQLLPLKGMWEDVLDGRLWSFIDPRLHVELDVRKVEALRDDLNTRLEAGERYVRMGASVDETSDILELGIPEGKPGRDVGLVQQGLAPIEMVASGITLAGGLQDPMDEGLPSGQGGEGQAGGAPNTNPDALPQEDKPQASHGRAQDATERERTRAARWRAMFSSVMGPAEAAYRRRYQGWVRGRRAETLAALERMNRALDPQEVDAWLTEAKGRWRDALRRQVKPLYPRMADAAAKGLLPDLGHPFHKFTMGSPRLLEFMARKDVLLVGVSDRVLDDVRRTVMEGLDAAESYQQVQDRIRGSFNTTMARSLAVARTETAQTVNGTRNIVMREEGITSTEWLTARDGNVREEHGPLDGKVVPIGESFLEGAVMDHPGDLRAPARQVVNCRCVAVPAVAAGQ